MGALRAAGTVNLDTRYSALSTTPHHCSVTKHVPTAVVACVALLALSACGEHHGPAHHVASTRSPAAEAARTPEPAATESSVTDPGGNTHTYPEHTTVRIVTLARFPRPAAADVRADQTPLKVTLQVTAGAADIPVDDQSLWLTVLAGPGRVETDQDSGYSGDIPDSEQASSPMPTRLPAGHATTIWQTYDVPTSELGELAVTVTIPTLEGHDGYQPWTFTHADTLLV